MGEFAIGQPVLREEDPRLLTGRGEFLNDVNLHGQAYGYVLRSPHAHATIAALDMNGNTTLEAVRAAAPEKLMLVIGGEDKSVGQFILNMADHTIGIPQSGRVNSLNASVAAGIAMHALGGPAA